MTEADPDDDSLVEGSLGCYLSYANSSVEQHSQQWEDHESVPR
jgi:hypothetical protein